MLYAQVTTPQSAGPNQHGRGNVLTQILLACETYYVFSSVVATVAEFGYQSTKYRTDNGYASWMIELIDSMRHHQDIGVDDWTRLLVHSIFLNLIDELTHFSATTGTTMSPETESSSTAGPGPGPGSSTTNMSSRSHNDDGSSHNEKMERDDLELEMESLIPVKITSTLRQ